MEADERYGHDIKYSICPINMYFEGDEDKCNISKCDFNIEFRCCHQTCKVKPEPKPLAQYLAEYLDAELTRVSSGYREYYSEATLQGWFEQALDAYESTENVKIKIEKQ